jgi:hypothetical protein
VDHEVGGVGFDYGCGGGCADYVGLGSLSAIVVVAGRKQVRDLIQVLEALTL